MSLYGSIQLANNALRAQQVGLQVVGQNIANANTPGYSRAEAVLSPLPTQRVGSLLLGLGVEVKGVRQQIDNFLEQRLRTSTSDRASLEAQEKAYQDLEGVLGVVGDPGLGTSLDKFFSSINDVLNQPESTSVRNLAVLQGRNLTSDIQQLSKRVTELRNNTDSQISSAVDDANRLIDQIRTLNIRIASLEGGESTGSDAVGLRDQRNVALSSLAELVDIRVSEQPSGLVNVFVGGDYVVFEGETRHLATQIDTSGDTNSNRVVIRETGSPAQLNSGAIAGLLVGRDDVLGKFQTSLDDFTRNLVYNFNKVFSGGQGQSGYQHLTSEFSTQDSKAPLDAASLTFSPTSGSFTVHVFNKQTGLTQQTTIPIDLNGLDGNDTTLESLRSALDAIDGIKATILPTGQLQLDSESVNVEFAFGDDTSGVLASLGLATFFTGTSASTIGINKAVLDDPGKFAASRSGINGDTANAVDLAGLLDKQLDSAGGATINDLLERARGDVAQSAAATKSVADGYRSFEGTLKAQQLSVSGVNLDEEAVNLISYQRAYQASAKFIAVLNELLDSLVNL